MLQQARKQAPAWRRQHPPGTPAAGPELEQVRHLRAQSIPAPKKPQGAAGWGIPGAALALCSRLWLPANDMAACAGSCLALPLDAQGAPFLHRWAGNIAGGMFGEQAPRLQQAYLARQPSSQAGGSCRCSTNEGHTAVSCSPPGGPCCAPAPPGCRWRRRAAQSWTSRRPRRTCCQPCRRRLPGAGWARCRARAAAPTARSPHPKTTNLTGKEGWVCQRPG